MATPIKIKKTTGLILDGNTISGNTYPAKDYIKCYLNGKWDKDAKVWVVDTAKVDELLDRIGSSLRTDTNAPVVTVRKQEHHSGWCNKCHSYCYGDCEAN